jgi:hypothetical protein
MAKVTIRPTFGGTAPHFILMSYVPVSLKTIRGCLIVLLSQNLVFISHLSLENVAVVVDN